MFAVGEIFGVDGSRVAVGEVDAGANFGGNSGGESHLDAGVFDAVFKSASSADMGGVSEDTAGDVGKAVPLLEEVVSDMVADFLDQFSVSDGDLVHVGGVDDEFATIGDDGFELVHAFARDPEFIVHGRGAGEDLPVGFVAPTDVDLRGEAGGLIPGGFGSAVEHAVEIGIFIDDKGEAAAGLLNE